MMLDEGQKPEMIKSDSMNDAFLNSPASSPSGYSGQPDDMHDLLGESGKGLTDVEDPLAALRNDPNYSALIRDLESIASQARLLFQPAEEAPSDELWGKIKNQLDTEPQG
jgi:hypothetical protein